MAAEHEPNSRDRFEQEPDVVPQVTTHEVSPGNRRNFGTGFSHLLRMFYIPDTGKTVTIHFSFRTTLWEKYYYWHFTAEQSGLKGIVCTHTHWLPIAVQKEPEVTHCPSTGQNQKHVSCVIGSLNKDVKMAWWVLWTAIEAVNGKRNPPGPFPLPWTLQLWTSAKRLSFQRKLPDFPVLVFSCSGWHRVKWLLLYLQLIYIKSERSNSHRVK